MWARALSGRRFFARVVRAELACPRCNRVLIVRPAAAKIKAAKAIWEPRLQRLTCPDCRGIWYLGLLAWPAPRDPRPTVPPDAVPDPAQAKALVAEREAVKERRAQYRNLTLPHRRRRGEQVNVVVEGGGGPDKNPGGDGP